jgi:5'-methylthioadenosine phosphorylase
MDGEGKAQKVDVGILGGSGFYEIDGINNVEEISLDTPLGKPSDVYVLGELEGKRVAFLNRHGQGHRILPSEINYRANIYGFKMLGVERVISVNSVGSLKEGIEPQDILFADQFFDKTRRKDSFFGEGLAAHIGFAQPVCPDLSDSLFQAGKELGLKVHKGGTYICIDGPAFSTRAESNIYRSWGCHVIGMTSVTEAKLCREAEICYATMNLVSDYDAWHEEEEPVSIEMILESVRRNIHNAKAIIKKAVSYLSVEKRAQCACGVAMENIIVTNLELIPEETKKKLRLIIHKYLES